MELEEKVLYEIQNIVEDTFGANVPPQLKKELISEITKSGQLDVESVVERFANYGYIQRVSTSAQSRTKDYQSLDYKQTLDFIHQLEQMNQSLLNNNISIENANKTTLHKLINELDHYHKNRDIAKANELKRQRKRVKDEIATYQNLIADLEQSKQSFQNKLMHKLFNYYDTQIQHIDILIHSYQSLIDNMKHFDKDLSSANNDYRQSRVSFVKQLKEGELDEQTPTKEDS